ncbi:MAG TPA: c-type cytochrome domain-containing protein, partial [Planctomycetota bacterium]|nr:c-type cytochrome domain-containing protein [Planctomycetota bacterium]
MAGGSMAGIRVLLALMILWPSAAAQERPAEPVKFSRDIQPLLAENCLACHGADPKSRKADLRLDTREGLLAKLDEGRFAVVAGDP